MLLLSPKKHLGTCSSDSGQLIITDPSYVNSGQAMGQPMDELAVSFNTEVGDGEFSVYEERNRYGQLKRIVIEIE